MTTKKESYSQDKEGICMKENSIDWLSDVEYKALQYLYHNFHSAFILLPPLIISAYYARLLKKEIRK